MVNKFRWNIKRKKLPELAEFSTFYFQVIFQQLFASFLLSTLQNELIKALLIRRQKKNKLKIHHQNQLPSLPTQPRPFAASSFTGLVLVRNAKGYFLMIGVPHRKLFFICFTSTNFLHKLAMYNPGLSFPSLFFWAVLLAILVHLGLFAEQIGIIHKRISMRQTSFPRQAPPFNLF